MTFTISVKVDTNDKHIKDECLEILAKFLNEKGKYFDVGYDPTEIDIDALAKA